MSESDAPLADANDNLADAGEGTTPAEVAEVLKSSGINLPEGSVDDEEGEDPDKGEDTPDEPETPEPDEEPEEKEQAEDKKPEPKPVPELAADDEKYSFEVTDANGVTFKIAVGAKMEDILAEFEPKNNGQIIDILNQLSKLDNQKTADEAKAAEDATKAERSERAAELLKGWEAEAEALQGSKRIPEGSDGKARIDSVYKFMADTNEQRMKDNKPTINSFEDALDKLEAKEARDKAVADAKAEKDKAREIGGKVGGASAPASSAPSPYKAGSARNSNEAIRALGLL